MPIEQENEMLIAAHNVALANVGVANSHVTIRNNVGVVITWDVNKRGTLNFNWHNSRDIAAHGAVTIPVHTQNCNDPVLFTFVSHAGGNSSVSKNLCQ